MFSSRKNYPNDFSGKWYPYKKKIDHFLNIIKY